MKNVIQAVKGTRDFYPEQMAVRNWLYGIFREVSESFGYQEYEAPILESLELYAAKSGEELVMEQAYVFEDRGGSKIALRPDLTLSLARMIAQKQNQLNFPVRWWSFGPFWRYERPQKGRTREFFQWNVDLLGMDSPEADAENVAVLAAFLEKAGLKADQVTIQVNDRRLMEEQFDRFDIPKGKRAAVYAWVDRREKMPPDEWEAYGKEAGLNSTQLSNMKSMLEDKSLWKQSKMLKRFFAASEAIGFNRYITFDPATVRGLQYYTGTVFEAWEIGPWHRWLTAAIIVLILATVQAFRLMPRLTDSPGAWDFAWRRHPRRYYHERPSVLGVLIVGTVAAIVVHLYRSGLVSLRVSSLREAFWFPSTYLALAVVILAGERALRALFWRDGAYPTLPRVPSLACFCTVWLATLATIALAVPLLAALSFAVWLGPWYRL